MPAKHISNCKEKYVGFAYKVASRELIITGLRKLSMGCLITGTNKGDKRKIKV